ncbi:unnamed protein product [Arctogadus glacialis]
MLLSTHSGHSLLLCSQSLASLASLRYFVSFSFCVQQSLDSSSPALFLPLNKSFLQARCDEPIMTSDWGLPLLLALLLLALLYAFLYLPSMAQRALMDQAMANHTLQGNATPGSLTLDDHNGV